MPYLFSKHYPWRNLIFVLGEGTIIFLIICSVFITGLGFNNFGDLVHLYVFRAFIVTVAFQLCFYYFDLYDYTSIPEFLDHFLKVVQTFGVGCILLAFLYYFFPVLTISSNVFWPGISAAVFAILIVRFFYYQVIERRLFVQSIALIGTGKLAGEITEAINRKKDSGYRIAALVGDKGLSQVPGYLPIYEDIKDLKKIRGRWGVDKIVLAPDERRGQLPMHDLIQYKFSGVEIIDAVRFYEELTGKIFVERMNPSTMLFSDGFYVGRLTKICKRLLDVLAASALLLISLPVLLFSALIIKLESQGGIFYCQERVGKNGKIFKIIKFRSMTADAEKNGPVWAAVQDNRVTHYGKLIRKVRIDELPQLINVLMGDMSFVGPRPERPVFVEELIQNIPFYSIRHVIKPGITGWAQINYPYGASTEDALRKLEYDLYYIKNLSIGMDLSTIFKTVKVVLFQKGAR